MDKNLNILVQIYFNDSKDYYKLSDYLNRLNGENVKNQLAKDLVNYTKISNNDLYNIFKQNSDLYYSLHEKDILFENIINFFTNEQYFNREKNIFKPYEYLIKGKTLKYKDLNHILLSYDSDPDSYKFIDNILIRVLSKMISELEHIYGFHTLETLNLGLEDYNKYVSTVQEKLELYNKIILFFNKEDKSQFIKIYLEKLIDKINETLRANADSEYHELNKKPINIKLIIEIAEKYKIQTDVIQIENYKTILNNVERIKDVYVKFNVMMIINIIQNAKFNKEYENILLNNDLIIVVDSILTNIFNKYENVFLEKKFKNIIFFKYIIESMIAIELNSDIINKKIINILKEKYSNIYIDDKLISDIMENSNLNDLYIFPIETQLVIKLGINLLEFEKIVVEEIKHDLNINTYTFNISILRKMWPNMLIVDLIKNAKNILSKMNLSEDLFLEIFKDQVYNENDLEKISFPLKLYKNPLEALIAFDQNIDITNIDQIWFKINIPKDISKLNDIIIKHTKSKKINKSNFDNFVRRIRESFFKTNKYKNSFVINNIKLKKELLEYINSFYEITESDAIILLNDILSKNIFEYDVFQKIIVYKYPIEVLLCIMLDVPINDELFKKVYILPSIHILKKAKKQSSFLSAINADLIKEINLFLCTFNKYTVNKFLKKLETKTTLITDSIRLNVKNEISKINLKSIEITYKPTEEEVVKEILKSRFELSKIINDEISKVSFFETNLDKHVNNIKLRYDQLGTNINLVERRIANAKNTHDYSALIEEKIFNSNNYKLNTTIIIFMCIDKNLLWFKAQKPEVKYKILCDIIENGLNKKYVPEYVNDYLTFENYLYNVFYKFICNTLITPTIKKYNLNYKSPKVEFLKSNNLTDTKIEIINDKPYIKKKTGDIIEMKKVNNNIISLNKNTNILKFNDTILFYNVDYLFAAEEDFVFLSNDRYYYDSLMYIMPLNMIINESSTKHVQYYIDGVSYFAKDIVPVYEYLYLKIYHDINTLNKDILNQYNHEDDLDYTESGNLKKRIAKDTYTQEIVLENLKNGDFSKINYLYTYENLNDDTILFLKSNLIFNNEEYIKFLKEIFKDLIMYEESTFEKEIKYNDRMNTVWHLETNYFFKVKDFCKDLEYIIYTFYNADYNNIIEKFSDLIFEKSENIDITYIKPFFTLEEIEYFQNYIYLQDYGVYPITIPYEVGISSSKFSNLKNEYLELCKLFLETLGYEENYNINVIYNNISNFLTYMGIPSFITLKNKIIIETNDLDFENDIIKTIKVQNKRMDKFVKYIIQSIESKITISLDFFDVFYNSFEKYIKIKHKLILIDVNPTLNIGIVHKLFGLSLFAPIKFIPNEIDNIDIYKETLEYLYQNLNVYTIKIKSLNSNILDLLNNKIIEINNYKEIIKIKNDKKYCEKKVGNIIKKFYYFNPNKIIDEYYKVEFKYKNIIKILYDIINEYTNEKNNDLSKIFESIEPKNTSELDIVFYETNYSEDEFLEILNNINKDIYNISNYSFDKKFTISQFKTIHHLFNTIISTLNQKQILDSEKSRLCRFILLYNDIKIKEIKNKNYSNIRIKFFNRLIKKYIFLTTKDSKKKLNIYFKDCYQLINKSELNKLFKKENMIYMKNSHYETEMNNLIDNLTLNNF